LTNILSADKTRSKHTETIQHKATDWLNDRASIIEWCEEFYLRQRVQAEHSVHRLLSEVYRLLFFQNVRVTSTATSRSMCEVIPSIPFISPMSWRSTKHRD